MRILEECVGFEGVREVVEGRARAISTAGREMIHRVLPGAARLPRAVGSREELPWSEL